MPRTCRRDPHRFQSVSFLAEKRVLEIDQSLMHKPKDLWQSVDWKEISNQINQTQIEIYNLAREKQTDLLHTVQRQFLDSKSAKLIAVKRVTQDNRGKATAGVDGISQLNSKERLQLAVSLQIDSSASPIRRVLIPKPGSSEKRVLGIPTIKDRAKQALIKLALEPEWEARFEEHSFGFRPGRRCPDATWRIRHKLRYAPCWVYNAEIEKCFGCINHLALLNKLRSLPLIQIQVRAWLEAGIFDKGEPFPSSGIGTPQGGVILPLLANIALDGIQEKVWQAVYKLTNRKASANKVLFVRYANNFVILSPEREWLEASIQACSSHFSEIGLRIKPQKTRVVHTLPSNGLRDKEKVQQITNAESNPKLYKQDWQDTDTGRDFEFLGFTFSQRRTSIYKAAKLGKRTTTLVAVVLPSQRKIRSHFKEIGTILKESRNSFELVRRINPIIRGWCNYYKYSDARTYTSLPGKLDSRLNKRLRRWIKQRYKQYGCHPDFWTQNRGDHWVFYTELAKGHTRTKLKMEKYSWSSWSLQSYNRVDSKRSPYDGDSKYWSRHPGMRLMGMGSPKRDVFLRMQDGLCAHCGQPFGASELVYSEIDHIKPRSKGGNEDWNNQQLLHRECHTILTRDIKNDE